MNTKTWHRGPPPSVGWWPASLSGMTGIYRWWNGEFWSRPAEGDFSPAEAGAMASERGIGGGDTSFIEWQHRPNTWPKRSFT